MTSNRAFLSLSNGDISCYSHTPEKCNTFAFLMPEVVVCDRQSLALSSCRVLYGKYTVELSDAHCLAANASIATRRTCHITANIDHAISVHELNLYAIYVASCVLVCVICAMFFKTRSTLKKQEQMLLQKMMCR